MDELLVIPHELTSVSSTACDVADSLSTSRILDTLSEGTSAMPGSTSRASMEDAGTQVDTRKRRLVEDLRTFSDDVLAARNAFMANEENLSGAFQRADVPPAIPSSAASSSMSWLVERLG